MGYGDSKHPLFVRLYVICGISSAIVKLHVWERELIGHLYESDGINERVLT